MAIRDYLGPNIVEVGSGVGNITQFLLNARQVVCLEPYGPFREFLARRFEKHLNVIVHAEPIENCPNANLGEGEFDSVVCLNVLEHIPDDVHALACMRKLLRPGGKVIALAPALPYIYGAMDKDMGHVRRYTRRSLKRAMVQAGLIPGDGFYMNMPGVFGWWWHGHFRRRKNIPESATLFYDRLVPFVSAVERLLPVPFGQSVVVIGTAP